MSAARVGSAAAAVAAASVRRARGGFARERWRNPHAGALVLLLSGVGIVSFLISSSRQIVDSGTAKMAASAASVETAGDGEAIAVFVTAPSKEVARSIADVLLEKRLAGCINIVPGIESVYEWQGKIERDDEVLLMIKSMRGRLQQLTEAVKTAHPYDTPEVISTAITGGSSDYLSWLAQAVVPRQ